MYFTFAILLQIIMELLLASLIPNTQINILLIINITYETDKQKHTYIVIHMHILN